MSAAHVRVAYAFGDAGRLLALAALIAALGCSSNASIPSPGLPEPGDASPGDCASADGSFDACDATDAPPDTPPKPRRLPCLAASALGHDLPSDQFGALEGEIVALVPPATKGCPSDSRHLHLQVDVAGGRYDVAVTISSNDGMPIGETTRDLPAPGTLTAPGWSSSTFDFPTDLGVSSSAFTPLTSDPLLAQLTTELSTASRVSIHGRSYSDGSGVHNVHRNGGDGHDGVILMRGAGPGGKDHAIALRFSADVF